MYKLNTTWLNALYLIRDLQTYQKAKKKKYMHKTSSFQIVHARYIPGQCPCNLQLTKDFSFNDTPTLKNVWKIQKSTHKKNTAISSRKREKSVQNNKHDTVRNKNKTIQNESLRTRGASVPTANLGTWKLKTTRGWKTKRQTVDNKAGTPNHPLPREVWWKWPLR